MSLPLLLELLLLGLERFAQRRLAGRHFGKLLAAAPLAIFHPILHLLHLLVQFALPFADLIGGFAAPFAAGFLATLATGHTGRHLLLHLLHHFAEHEREVVQTLHGALLVLGRLWFLPVFEVLHGLPHIALNVGHLLGHEAFDLEDPLAQCL